MQAQEEGLSAGAPSPLQQLTSLIRFVRGSGAVAADLDVKAFITPCLHQLLSPAEAVTTSDSDALPGAAAAMQEVLRCVDTQNKHAFAQLVSALPPLDSLGASPAAPVTASLVHVAAAWRSWGRTRTSMQHYQHDLGQMSAADAVAVLRHLLLAGATPLPGCESPRVAGEARLALLEAGIAALQSAATQNEHGDHAQVLPAPVCTMLYH